MIQPLLNSLFGMADVLIDLPVDIVYHQCFPWRIYPHRVRATHVVNDLGHPLIESS